MRKVAILIDGTIFRSSLMVGDALIQEDLFPASTRKTLHLRV